MKGMPNLQKMMKTAKEMQEKMQKELAEMRVEGSSGGGMVSVALDGNKNLLSINIEPEVVNKDDVEINDAVTKVDEKISEKFAALGPGLKIPGLF